MDCKCGAPPRFERPSFIGRGVRSRAFENRERGRGRGGREIGREGEREREKERERERETEVLSPSRGACDAHAAAVSAPAPVGDGFFGSSEKQQL